MKKIICMMSCACALACGSVGHAQIQYFEFGYGLTNTLAIPYGKVIRIHSLISTSASLLGSTDNQSSRDLVSQAISQAQRGIIIRLESGREITLSPFNVTLGGSSWNLGATILSTINSVTPNSPLLVPGPITILKNGDYASLLIYEIYDNVGSSALTQTANQGASVVVPTSAAGDVDVKMEQSADNVTWTECLPGTYNSSTVKRFFRLRAVEK